MMLVRALLTGAPGHRMREEAAKLNDASETSPIQIAVIGQ
jgi:hypothetical protein